MAERSLNRDRLSINKIENRKQFHLPPGWTNLGGAALLLLYLAHGQDLGSTARSIK
jgi:hypothetical protein